MNVSADTGAPSTVATGDGNAIASGVAEATGPARADWRRMFGLREMGVYYALLLLVLILTAVTAYTGQANYLSINNLVNVLYQSSLVAIMAVAITVVLITGNFDLSVASVAALSAAVMMTLADSLGFWPAISVAMLVAAAVGVLNGSIVQLLGINAFIVTLGTLTAIRGLVLLLTDGRALSPETPEVLSAMRSFESGRINVGMPILLIGGILVIAGVALAFRSMQYRGRLSPKPIGAIAGGLVLLFLAWASGLKFSVPNPVIYMGVFSAIIWFVLTFTTIGRRVHAVGGNPEAARLSGINVTRYKMAAFVLCSVAAGFAGVLLASRLRSINPGAMQGAELTVIAAAILGGTSLYGGAGSVIKTLAGAFLLFALTNGFNMLNLGANYQGVVEGTVIVTAAAIYTVGGSTRGRKR